MPNVADVLKQEITRLARKEVRAGCVPLQKQISKLRETVAKQKDEATQLKKAVSHLNSQLAKNKMAVAAPPAEDQPKARISPASIKRQRTRLKLSQAQMGKVLNVSTNTVVRWEAGSSVPRARHKAEIAKLRKMGRREIKKLLEKKK